MVLMEQSFQLTTDNNFHGLCDVVDEQEGTEAMSEQMVQKFQLISSIHKFVLENVEQAQKKQHKVNASQKGLQFFEGFERRDVKVKSQKLGKKKNLVGSWEGPNDFVGYKDPKRVLNNKMKGA